MKTYTVALLAEYVVDTEDILDDDAVKKTRQALTGTAEEVDAEVISTYKKLFGGYTAKVAANMVVDVESETYLTAYHEAVEKIESLPYNAGVELVAVGSYDVTLAEEKILLEKPVEIRR